VHHHDVGASDHARDRCDVAEEIEIEVLVERCVGRAGGAALEERVSVGRRAYNRLGADIAAAARTVLDDERLAEALRQPLAHQTGDDVSRSAGSEWHDQTYRPRRIGLRPRNAGNGRQRSSARGQMQKLSAGKFHWRLPPSLSLLRARKWARRAMRAFLNSQSITFLDNAL